MSNYTKSTNFATKDNLTPGDPLKVVRGTEIDTEFNNISTAIATKTDNSAAAITGGAIDGATVGATTPATGAFTTLAASGTTTLAGALVGAATQSAFNTVSTTLNLGGAATALNLGAATGTATVNNTTLAAKAITASTTLAVTGTSTLTGAVTATAGVSGPITSSSVSITGGSITGITDLAVADGGTGASTAAGGLNNLLPSQTGNASKYLQTDGTNASWDAVSLSTADITGTLGAANGGTGVSNNAAMTVTGSGNFAYTRTLTGTTNVTFPTTGTLATLAGTETLTNKTLTSPILTTPTLGVATGTSFQGIIGNVTPAAGSFTTLGASSTATLNTLSSSGATLTGGTINGMTVGATTPSSGAFTTVTASTAIGTASGGTGLTSFTSGGVVYASSTSALATGSALTFNGTNLSLPSGNFSVGLTTSGQGVTIYNGDAVNAQNLRLSMSGTNAVIDATRFSGTSPQMIFQTDTTERMRLTSTGLGIGTSSPAAKLQVQTGNIYVNNNGSALLWFNSAGSGAGIQNDATGVFSLASGNNITTLNTPVLTWLSNGGATNGNVGIGTSSPTAKLQIGDATVATSNRIVFGKAIASSESFLPAIGQQSSSGVGNDLALAATSTSGVVRFYTGASTNSGEIGTGSNTEKMRLDSAGNLGLGIASATYTGSGVLGINVAQTGNGILGNSSNVWVSNNVSFNSGFKYARTSTASLYNQSAGSHVWSRAASGTAGDAISFTDSMTLDASGRLGLGITSPSYTQQIQSATTSSGATPAFNLVINRQNSATEGLFLGMDGNNDAVIAPNNAALRFGTVVTGTFGEKARIDSSGNLLVGKTALSDVTTGVQIYGGAEGSMALGTAGTGGANNIEFFRGTAGSLTSVGKIQTTGTATSYITSSDYRLKENIAPMTGALANVAQLKPCTYTWKADGSSGQGFIAHELQSVVPDAVVGEKDAVDADGKIKPQGIDTSFLVATLTAAIQEQQAIIESLKARLDAANL